MSMLDPNTLHDSNVLDCFAGSGAMGFEALSRGAGHATFVDASAECCRQIRRSAEELKVSDRTTIHKGDFAQVLARLEQAGERFDLLFFDPPYEEGSETLGRALAGGLRLAVPRARLVAELPADAPLPSLAELELAKTRRYGNTAVAIYTPLDSSCASYPTHPLKEGS